MNTAGTNDRNESFAPREPLFGLQGKTISHAGRLITKSDQLDRLASPPAVNGPSHRIFGDLFRPSPFPATQLTPGVWRSIRCLSQILINQFN